MAGEAAAGRGHLLRPAGRQVRHVAIGEGRVEEDDLEDVLPLRDDPLARPPLRAHALARAEGVHVRVGAVEPDEGVGKEEEEAHAVGEAGVGRVGPEVEKRGDKVAPVRLLQVQPAERLPLQLHAAWAEHEAAVAKDAGVLAHVAQHLAVRARELDLGLGWVVAGHGEDEAADALERGHRRQVCGELLCLRRPRWRVHRLVKIARGHQNASVRVGDLGLAANAAEEACERHERCDASGRGEDSSPKRHRSGTRRTSLSQDL